MRQPATRRRFLQAAAAAPAAALLGCVQRAEPAAAPGRTPVVDTHLHCFAGKDDARFPYHPRGPYKPDKPATPEHLLACMDGAGVDFAVVVHPEPYQDDHRYLEHCLAVGKGRLKGTALVFAEREESVKLLPDLVKRLGVLTARIHAYAPDRLPPFGKPELRALWKAAADQGIAVQLHFEPRYAPGFEPLIREFSKTTVIIDHLGRPFQGTPAEHAVVVNWGKLPNTVIKLSAIPQQRQYPHRDIGPIIRQLTDAFGAERCIYGGGYGDSATGASYRAERERTRGYIAHLSAEHQAAVLGGNAARLFGLKV
jgi:predicted TIM-barrel fold metal-dependent hydrolase